MVATETVMSEIGILVSSACLTRQAVRCSTFPRSSQTFELTTAELGCWKGCARQSVLWYHVVHSRHCCRSFKATSHALALLRNFIALGNPDGVGIVKQCTQGLFARNVTSNSIQLVSSTSSLHAFCRWSCISTFSQPWSPSGMATRCGLRLARGLMSFSGTGTRRP